MSIPWITIIIIVVVALAILGVLDEIKTARKDRAILRHTVEVNLGILKKELLNLNAIAAKSPVDDDHAEATKLLAAADTTVKQVEAKNFDTISHGQLTVLLTAVFEAMNQTSHSRHLLKACLPIEDLHD
jgi:ABC-type hemin transport system ATPase subunit